MNKARALAGSMDQVFSSLSNGLILYAIAVVATVDDFGKISLLFTLLAAATGFLRGALGTPLLLKAASGEESIRREAGHATAAALMSAVAVALAVLVTGVLLGAGPESVLVAVSAPIVLTQDVLRYVAITSGRPQLAALWDGVWCIGSLAFLVLTWFSIPWLNTIVLVAGWSLLAFIALVFMELRLLVAPLFKGFTAWLRDGWEHRVRYGADVGLEQVSVFVVLVLSAAIVEASASGALRGATAVLAPIAIIVSAVPLVVIPESKRAGMSSSDTWATLTRIALVTSVLAAGSGFVISILPDGIGRLILGDTFELTRSIVILIALQYTVGVWNSAVSTYLRSQNRSREVLWLKLMYIVVTLSAVFIAAWWLRSAAGIAAALATATTFNAAATLLLIAPWAEDAKGAAPKGTAVKSTRGLERERRELMARLRHVDSGDVVYRRLRRVTERDDALNGLLGVGVALVLGVVIPAVTIESTDSPDGYTWLGPLGLAVLAASRLAWLMMAGQRRLFEMTFWVFTYVFMGLAPLAQIRDGSWPPTVPRADWDVVNQITLLVAIGCVAFLLGTSLESIVARRRSTRQVGQPEATGDTPRFSISWPRLLVFSLGTIAFNIYYLAHVGVIQFLKSRDQAFEAYDVIWRPGSFGILVRAATYMSLLVAFVALVRWRREAKVAVSRGGSVGVGTLRLNLLLAVVVGLLLANSMNPISNARYLSGTAILAAAAALGLFATVRRYRIMTLGFVLGMVFIFPMADAFRYSSEAEFKSTNPLDSLLSADYDSFAQIGNGLLVAARDGIVPGKQFLGVLVWWFPRTAWPEKPVDTGIYIANGRGYPFTNLSSPLWIEIFLNGGWVLLVVVMFVIGYGIHRWDTRIDGELQRFGSPGVLSCILPFYTLILLRGSLLQAMSYFMLIVVFALMVRAYRSPREIMEDSSSVPATLKIPKPPKVSGNPRALVGVR
ncbi:hypothetical protein [Gordonia sp. NPDC003422]